MGEFWEKITGSISAGSFAPPKWFRRDNLLILVLLGVLLFIIALPVKKEDPAATGTGTEITEQYNAGILTSSGQQNVAQQDTVYVGTQAVTAGSMEEYAAYLEEKLKKMLESVRGVGEVEVMITLESSEERIVEKDMTAERSQTEEQDSAGGTRTVSSSNTGYQTVYQESPDVAPGEEVIDQYGHTGYYVRTWRNIYDGDGNLLSSRVEADSHYDVGNKIILVAPGYLPGDSE